MFDGFQVSMKNPPVMCRDERVCDLKRVVDGVALGERAARPDAIDVLEDEVICADVEHLADVRMAQRRNRARFLLEPADPLRIRREHRRKDLDGDVPAEPGITRAIHVTHPAGAQRGRDLIGAEPGARCQGHRRWAVRPGL